MNDVNPSTKIYIEKKPLPAGLYLVGTPIGTLKDISVRALETLMSVDIVACEDTRVTGKLLHHYGIDVKKIKYNDHSDEYARTNIISLIEQGQSVALCSDAGLPLIADPGYRLVRACAEKKLHLTSVPGANAALTGLQISGLPTDQFIFLGFVPHKTKAKRDLFVRWADLPMTHIYYETAHRILDTLHVLDDVMGGRQIVIVRELTKKFEETYSGCAHALIERLRASPIKGEVVLMISGDVEHATYTQEDILSLLTRAITQESLSVKDAVQTVMKQTGHPKKALYDMALKVKDGTLS